MKIETKNILTILSFFLPLILLSQPKDNSPYSRFGMGDIVDRNFFSSQFMGGLGASFTDAYQINIVNPAALSHLTTTSLDIGLSAELSSLRDGVTDQNPVAGPYQSIWTGNLNYISLALPLQNRVNDLLERKEREYSIATAVTLMPFSTVGYNIALIDDEENIGEVKRSFEGVGGSYQFLWSNAIRYKNLSFGANLGYLFGKLEYTRTVEFDVSQPFFNTVYTKSNRVTGFLWDLGLIYSFRFNAKDENSEGSNERAKQLNIGIHGHSSTSFTSNASSFAGSVQNGTGIVDSLEFQGEESHEGKLPAELGLGISYYSGEKFGFGLNYSRTNWSDFTSNFVNNSLNNTSSLSFGGYYRPNYKSISNYFARVMYRVGFYYKQVPNAIPDFDDSINDVGISLGFGLPFFYQRKVSHANLGFNFGMKGNGTPVEEKYMRISFSFTFNDDEWFIKRKYN